MYARYLFNHTGRADGEAAVYELEPPYNWMQYDLDAEEDRPTEVKYVWVSAVPHVYVQGPETYIFHCDEFGNVLDWSEMPGSFKGSMNHTHALEGLGYERVVGESEPPVGDARPADDTIFSAIYDTLGMLGMGGVRDDEFEDDDEWDDDNE